MIVCPNCGGNLKFDIDTQAMHCEYCGSGFAPEDPQFMTQAGTNTTMNVTVFTCPQCGAEMYSEDNDATAFCSYCGASNILDKRMRGVKRPTKIIPFQKNKKFCTDAFGRIAKRSPYTPKEYHDPEYIDRFRPIYIPYWSYSVDFKGTLRMKGSKSRRKGDYIYTDHTDLSCELDSSFRDIPYDASAAFDDSLAREIAPFDTKVQKVFHEGYLSGFYANIADVDSSLYELEAQTIAAKEVARKVAEVKEFRGENYSLPAGEQLAKTLPVADKRADSAMYPVWFLSFRRGERVAYAVVNGQTGKVSCDLPVSIPRFFGFSLLTAIPLFLLLNLFYSLNIHEGLEMSAVLAVLTAVLYVRNFKGIRQKDEHLKDRGYLAAHFSELVKEVGKKSAEKTLKEAGTAQKASKGLLTLFLAFFVMLFLAAYSGWLLPAGGAIGVLVYTASAYFGSKPRRKMGVWPVLLCAAALAGCALIVWNPVSDLYFYGGSMVILLLICLSLYSIIRQYNLLATRPLPQLVKKGSAGAVSILLAAMLAGGILSGTAEKAYALTAPRTADAQDLADRILSGTIDSVTITDEVADDVVEDAEGHTSYRNAATGFYAVIEDDEDLLTESEEYLLLVQYMIPITEYGHVGFVSCSERGTDIERLQAQRYHEMFGAESGTQLLIDMGNREIGLFSDGEINKIIDEDYAYTITDNCYRYASYGSYFRCAATAFEQVNTLLSGHRIAQPMKYINNFLLALILGVLLNYIFLRILAASHAPGEAAILGSIAFSAAVASPSVVPAGTTKKYDPVSSSSGGGGGRSGGHSGGGHSGGFSSGSGGHHRF